MLGDYNLLYSDYAKTKSQIRRNWCVHKAAELIGQEEKDKNNDSRVKNKVENKEIENDDDDEWW